MSAITDALLGNPPVSGHQPDPQALADALEALNLDAPAVLAQIGYRARTSEPIHADYKIQVGSTWYSPDWLVVAGAGQSGMGENAGATSGDKTQDGNVYAWDNVAGAVVRAELGKEPFSTLYGAPNSIAFHAAKRLSRHLGRPVLIVNEPVAGSGIGTWQPGQPNYDNFDAAIQAALADPKLWGKSTVDVVLFNQGEDEGGIGPLWTLSEVNYRSLVKALQGEPWAGPEMQIILGEVMRQEDGGTAYRANREWRYFVASREFSRVKLASSKGLPVQSDGIHATGEGLVEYGRRYADVALGLTEGDPEIGPDMMALPSGARMYDGKLHFLLAEMQFDPTDVDNADITVVRLREGAKVVFEVDATDNEVAVAAGATSVVHTLAFPSPVRLRIWIDARVMHDEVPGLSVVAVAGKGKLRDLAYGQFARCGQVYIANHPGFTGSMESSAFPRDLDVLKVINCPRAYWPGDFQASELPPGLVTVSFSGSGCPPDAQAAIAAENMARGGTITSLTLGDPGGTQRQYHFHALADLSAALADGWSVPDGTLVFVGHPSRGAIRALVADSGAPVVPAWSPAGFRSVSDGEVSPEHFGAVGDGVTDDGAAWQAMLDFCRDNGLAWRARGKYMIAGKVTAYTSGDATGATIITTAAGQTDPVFEVASIASDVVAGDSSLLAAVNAEVAAGGLSRGQSVIASLGAYAGQSIRVASTTDYIARYGGANYRHEIFFQVLDGEGNITPPIPYDVGSGVSFTAADRAMVRSLVVIDGLRIEVNDGASDRSSSLCKVSRPNVVISKCEIVNKTPAKMAMLGEVGYTTGVTFRDCKFDGALEASTNYGLKVAGALVAIENCRGANSRRDIDGTYAIDVKVSGGIYPNGVGGHLIFDADIRGATIGSDAPNAAPIHIAGGNISIIGNRIARTGEGAIVNVRADVVEFFGSIVLAHNNIKFDARADTGTTDYGLVKFNAPAAAHDPGRAIELAAHIVVDGNAIEVTGTGHTGRAVVGIDDMSNISGQSVQVSGSVAIRNNDLNFTNGAPVLRVSSVRSTNWTGDGYRIEVASAGTLQMYLAALAGHAAPSAARHDVHVTAGGNVTVDYDYEAVRRSMIDCDTYAESAAASATSAVGDEEWWHKINGGAPQIIMASLADDAAWSFPVPTNYATYMLVQRNGAAAGVAAQFSVDPVSSVGTTIHWATGATVQGYGSVLVGTTGTDGQLNIGSKGGRCYVENRTGATKAFALVKVQEG